MKRLIALAAMLLSLAAAADESQIVLKDAPGRNAVLANCALCHSLDYIKMNSVFLDRKGWEAEVAKMRNAYKAPVSEADARTIVDYLAANYGLPEKK